MRQIRLTGSTEKHQGTEQQIEERWLKKSWEDKPGCGLDVWACSGTRGHSLATAT